MPIPAALIRLHAFADRVTSALAFAPPLIARISVGWVMTEAGLGHLRHLNDMVAYFRDDLHIPFASIQAPMAATTELVCGSLLMVGLFTRLAAIPLMGVMAVAIYTAYHPFVTSEKSWSDLFALSEYLYIVLLTWLAIYGGGFLSADRLLGRLCGKHCAATPEAKPASA
jgi:putative oxidoreductase